MSIPELKKTAIHLLIRELGELNTEIFIRSLLAEAGDYTTWQASFFDKDESIESFSQKAMQQRKEKQ